MKIAIIGHGVVGSGVTETLLSKREELRQKTEDEMMRVRNLGKKSLKEVKDKLIELGLGFKSFD